MTRYLDVDHVLRLIAEVGLEQVLIDLAGYLREDFRRWPQFDKAPRVAAHSPQGVIELMPVSDGQLYGFKYVNGHPGNTTLNALTVMAFGALADVATGFPLLLSELTITTALRTAATSAVAAQVLARPNARSMALIGNGAQSEFQAYAFHSLLGIREFRLFDVDPAATSKLARNLKGLGSDVTVVRAASVADAVRGADIVTTATADKRRATVVTVDMIEPGMHLNAVGGDCPGKTELDADILRAARVIVEFAPQTRIEGEIQQLPADFEVTELWQVLGGQAPGREHASQVTVFDSVGFALEDFSALRYLRDTATRLGIGEDLHLVPSPRDPKDLFGLLSYSRSRTTTTTDQTLSKIAAMPCPPPMHIVTSA